MLPPEPPITSVSPDEVSRMDGVMEEGGASPGTSTSYHQTLYTGLGLGLGLGVREGGTTTSYHQTLYTGVRLYTLF